MVECGVPATHYCPESGEQYCDKHTEDYWDIFDDDSLKELEIKEAKP